MTSEGPNVPSPPLQADCDICNQLHDELTDAIRAVHEYLLLNYECRFDCENYAGDLGHLIQAQLLAHERLVEHQRTHGAQQQPDDLAA
jgi:hypothetical protein